MARIAQVVSPGLLLLVVTAVPLIGQPSAVSAQGKTGRANNLAQPASESGLEKEARALVTRMAGDQFDWVAARLADNMTGKVTAASIHGTWNRMVERLGPFKKILAAKQDAGLSVVNVTCAFARGEVNVEFIFEPSQRVAGLWIQPAPGRHWPSPTPPAQPPVVAASSTPSVRFNLNGLWRADDQQGELQTLRFQQDGRGLLICIVGVGEKPVVGGKFCYDARYENDRLMRLSVHRNDQADWNNQSIPENFVLMIDDPDHVRFHAQGYTVARVSPPHVDDAPCDRANTFHVDAEHAYMRAVSALSDQHNWEKVTCWLQIASVQGHAKSQGWLSLLLHDGKGAPQNLPQAFEWAKKGADQGDATGEIVLGTMYKNGETVPPDAERGQYWLNKGIKDNTAAKDKANMQMLIAGIKFYAIMSQYDGFAPWECHKSLWDCSSEYDTLERQCRNGDTATCHFIGLDYLVH